MTWYDLTHLITSAMPVYPGTEPPELLEATTLEREGFRETRLRLFSHTGTHMDAPSHMIAGAPSLDSMAIGALETIREAGLRVPDDIALVGFDDVPVATAVEPALTTVRQPIEGLGTMAAELLLNLLENPPDGQAPGQRIILPAKLIVRDSCGALRRRS